MSLLAVSLVMLLTIWTEPSAGQSGRGLSRLQRQTVTSELAAGLSGTGTRANASGRLSNNESCTWRPQRDMEAARTPWPTSNDRSNNTERIQMTNGHADDNETSFNSLYGADLYQQQQQLQNIPYDALDSPLARRDPANRFDPISGQYDSYGKGINSVGFGGYAGVGPTSWSGFGQGKGYGRRSRLPATSGVKY